MFLFLLSFTHLAQVNSRSWILMILILNWTTSSKGLFSVFAGFVNIYLRYKNLVSGNVFRENFHLNERRCQKDTRRFTTTVLWIFFSPSFNQSERAKFGASKNCHVRAKKKLKQITRIENCAYPLQQIHSETSKSFFSLTECTRTQIEAYYTRGCLCTQDGLAKAAAQ